MNFRHFSKNLLVLAALGYGASAQTPVNSVSFRDPAGDDNGPGTYVYPSDPVYKKGSYDLLGAKLTITGDKLDIQVQVSSNLEDPWKTAKGFSVQMIFVFIDADDKLLSGHRNSVPGLNNGWSMGSGWEKCIVICPAERDRLAKEVDVKCGGDMKSDMIIPDRVKAAGKNISASMKNPLGKADLRQCRFQVVMCGYESFPTSKDLLTRKVNEYAGQHRFGGGNDADCDPHIMDCLAGHATGEPEEVELQHKMLNYECAEDGDAKKRAMLFFIKPN